MSHLRKIMLEELQRRHYSEAHNAISTRWKDSHSTSSALPIAWSGGIFGNTKPNSSPCRSCRPAR